MNISEELLLSVSRKWLKENAVPVHLLLLIYVKKKIAHPSHCCQN